MGTTPRDGYRYPELSDEPNVPLHLRQLAEDVEAASHTAFECTSTTRPGSPPTNFIIRETDTGKTYIYTGTAWDQLGGALSGGGGGGGGSGVAAEAQYSAVTGSQSILNAGNGTAMGFQTADITHAAVTRTVKGSGHAFTLNEDGLWLVSATARYASGSFTGERYAGIHYATGDEQPLNGAGVNPPSGSPATVNVALNKIFTAGTQLQVHLYQSTGASRTLEAGDGGGWCRINFTLIA